MIHRSLVLLSLIVAVHITSAQENPKPIAAADLGDFGSGEPLPRADRPTRGVLKLSPEQGVFNAMDHWEQYDWKLNAKRWGHYEVHLRYALKNANMTVQLKHGETRLKKRLTPSPGSRSTLMGEIFIADAGPQEFSLYTPQSGQANGFVLEGIEFVPTHEGEPELKQADDGSITLHAKDATTWSEIMRYEPKPEKNCLGFWKSEDDMAEWAFVVTKPGRFHINVSHGCGGGNHGSEVEIRVGDRATRFIVQDTGGFQQWKEITAGEVELKEPGTYRLIIDPINKVKDAVLDVQKVVLKPLAGAKAADA
jgi:hypothetical protein